jgi:hypothetical protein
VAASGALAADPALERDLLDREAVRGRRFTPIPEISSGCFGWFWVRAAFIREARARPGSFAHFGSVGSLKEAIDMAPR